MEIMRILTSVFVIAAILATPAFSQSSPPGGAPVRLADALAKAQLQAPSMQSADAAKRAAEANLQQAGLRPNPTLSVEAENVLGSGRYSGFGGGEKTMSLSIPLELGGKRHARIGVARAESAAADIGAVAAQADVALQVTEAFVTLAAVNAGTKPPQFGGVG